MLVLPLSRRGRLRVKLGSASSTGSRRGGEAGLAIAVSSAAAGCARLSSRAFMIVAMLQAVCSRRGACWQVKPAAGRQALNSGTGSSAPAALVGGRRARRGVRRARDEDHELQRRRANCGGRDWSELKRFSRCCELSTRYCPHKVPNPHQNETSLLIGSRRSTKVTWAARLACLGKDAGLHQNDHQPKNNLMVCELHRPHSETCLLTSRTPLPPL
jgi:hypothetical protein